MTAQMFVQYPEQVFCAKTVVDRRTNTVYEFDLYTKHVYVKMLQRYLFFCAIDSEYYENQDVIAQQCGLSRQTVVKCVAKLQKIGLLEVYKKKLSGATFSNSYVLHQIDEARFSTN